MAVLKLSEWQDDIGRWHCADISNLGNNSATWWYIPRLLNISLDNYIKLLKNDFNVSYITFFERTQMVYFYWDSQSDMRKFKNFINRKAREKNFQI
jgi:hypothetical protein